MTDITELKLGDILEQAGCEDTEDFHVVQRQNGLIELYVGQEPGEVKTFDDEEGPDNLRDLAVRLQDLADELEAAQERRS